VPIGSTRPVDTEGNNLKVGGDNDGQEQRKLFIAMVTVWDYIHELLTQHR